MASVHKQPGKPFWYCAFTTTDSIRRFRSTKTKNKGQAEAICAAWEKAEKHGRAGTLTPDKAREVLTAGLEDIFLVSNCETLKTYTVRQWGKQWLESKLIENTSRTHERYAGVLERFYRFLGARANKNIAGVAATEISAFRDKLAAELSTNTANLAVKTLRVCFGAAYSQDLLTSNTAAKVKKLKLRTFGKRREFKPGEIRLLLQAAGDSEWRGLILTGLYTAQRLGDVARLRWNQVNLETKEIIFHVSKTTAVLPLPMAPALLDYFEGLPSTDNPSAFVFPKVAELAKRTGTLSNQFYKVMEQAGIAPARKNVETGEGHNKPRTPSALSFHSLRHSAVTFLKAAGVSDAVAQAIAGHQSAAVSKIYTHLSADDLRGAVNALPDVTK
jgi:integrase